MQITTKRLLTGILVPLALGGTLAACGDDDSNMGDMGGMNHTSSPESTSKASSGSGKVSDDAAAVDKAFVRQMVPHHIMAVDMAETAQAKAEHQELKDLADAIVTSQTAEIDQMETIAGQLEVTPDDAVTDSSMGHGKSMAADAATLGLSMNDMGMSMGMMDLENANPFDTAFIDEMTPHHEGAIRMAKAQLAGGESAELKKISTAIIAAQEKEIAQMAQWKKDWQ